MNLFQNLNRAIMAIVLLALVLVPSSLAYGYNTATPYPYYFGYGQPRVGAYTTQFPYAQGMYNYVSPPIGLTRYGADYYITNLREPVYPEFGIARVPNLYRPYYGYPYGSYGSQSWTYYKYYSTH